MRKFLSKINESKKGFLTRKKQGDVESQIASVLFIVGVFLLPLLLICTRGIVFFNAILTVKIILCVLGFILLILLLICIVGIAYLLFLY